MSDAPLTFAEWWTAHSVRLRPDLPAAWVESIRVECFLAWGAAHEKFARVVDEAIAEYDAMEADFHDPADVLRSVRPDVP